MLMAASGIGTVGGIVLIVLFWLLPFFVAHRIGVRKGRHWFLYAFFLGWIGVLILALLGPTSRAQSNATYHVPPELARRQAAQRKR